jgi:hypothetical protein
MKKAKSQTCAFCKFAVIQDSINTVCFRYPPQIAGFVITENLQVRLTGGHQGVKLDHWCGEFQEKKS